MVKAMSEGKLSSQLPLAAICFGYFVVILDTTVVNVALPALSRNLHTSTTGLQWIVDSYSLVFATLLLSAGALSDRRGAKSVFIYGIGLFTASSLACSLAQSTGTLIFTRCMQGIGAALSVPASLSLLQTNYTDQAARSRAFGIWGGVAGIAAGAGPVVGGALVTNFGWQSVFLLNVPIGIVGIGLASRYLPSTTHQTNGVDMAGQAAGIICLAGITTALIESGHLGWASPIVIAGWVLFLSGGGAFIAIENRARFPVLPLWLFSSIQFSAVTVIGLLLNLAFYGELFVMSLYFQQLRGLTPVQAGLALLPQMAMAVIGSTLSGLVMARTGPRLPMLVGLALGGLGLLTLAATGPNTDYRILILPLIAVGFGMSFTMPAATAAVMQAAPPERGGVASGILNSARQVGGVIGVALLGTLLAGSRSDFMRGFHLGIVIAGCTFLLGAILVSVLVPPIFQKS